jgi:uncharacterized protein YjbI with pentapeptide repeats
MDNEKLQEILRKHDLWLNGSQEGERADLRSANLRSANLRSADLSSADLSYANLRYADLSYADLSYANLRYADLSSADLSSADLSYANLRYADLSSADLRSADLRSANLSYANLRYADLSSADLSYANLRYAVYWSCRGNNKTIKTIHCDTYDIAYTDKVLQIGCEQHSILDWWKFSDTKISGMDEGALEWWKVWKPILRKIIKYSPAESNGFEDNKQ